MLHCLKSLSPVLTLIGDEDKSPAAFPQSDGRGWPPVLLCFSMTANVRRIQSSGRIVLPKMYILGKKMFHLGRTLYIQVQIFLWIQHWVKKIFFKASIISQGVCVCNRDLWEDWG